MRLSSFHCATKCILILLAHHYGAHFIATPANNGENSTPMQRKLNAELGLT